LSRSSSLCPCWSSSGAAAGQRPIQGDWAVPLRASTPSPTLHERCCNCGRRGIKRGAKWSSRLGPVSLMRRET
jgi:hypothetical protein